MTATTQGTTPGTQQIRRLLVANRGEIARRVFRSARSSMETVAVFSDPDRGAAHVRDADIAVALGGVTSTESYLDVAKILAAAKHSGADAIHPGYGFLSENPDFAQAVTDAGLIWVGPTPDSIRAMALKVEAKRLAEAAGVPLVPGAEIDADASDADLIAAGNRVGYPLLVKASAGGGGKGMRTVNDESGLLDAVTTARREAASSFGDPTVFFERYLVGARHVEVQVFGDSHGNAVHLYERECSIQRRHQKIVEESPSPGSTPETLYRMYAAAVSLTSEIGYVGAGTVEFLVAGSGESQEFFFLEMNTRLQVEHPVTEEVVPGLDLVEWQLIVAQGGLLPLGQEQIPPRRGHAIEVRLYAEDPAANYLPSTGTVETVGYPSYGRNLSWTRDDLSVDAGDEVTPYYDPMIGKIITSGMDRTTVALNLARNLRSRDIAGITTNRDSLVAILESADFLSGETPTDFLDHHPELTGPQLVDDATRDQHLVAAALAAASRSRDGAAWATLAPIGWRNVRAVPDRVDLEFHEAGEDHAKAVVIGWDGVDAGDVELRPASEEAGFSGDVTGSQFAFEAADIEDEDDAIVITLELDGVARALRVAHAGEWTWVNDGRNSTTYRMLPRFADSSAAAAGGGPAAPVPGTVVAVNVADGEAVVEGQTLLVLEAMKMEHKITAHADAVVGQVLVGVGDAVDAHQVLVTLIDPDAAAGPTAAEPPTATGGNQ
ncbi:MAG: acetyl/propionyl/methylcrotonyl-CoA carboxylase subunit alpha [Candidatus Nanopelagicales bacterium]